MRFAGMLASGLVVAACVVGTDRPAARVDVARAATGESSAAPETGAAVGCRGERAPRRARPDPRAVWVEGYCHFDGVRYVSVSGRWEMPLAQSRP
ncbi:MAG TPA: hypothetical protein VHC69_10140 [Polyangiaceae bacterium]|nr:hypothetical protein [Polyangiaceae bacterium]